MGKNEKEREIGLTWAVIGRRCHCEAHSLWSFRPQRFDNLQLFVSELRFFAKPKPKPNRAQVQSATGLAILGWQRERERHRERERDGENVWLCVSGLDLTTFRLAHKDRDAPTLIQTASHPAPPLPPHPPSLALLHLSFSCATCGSNNNKYSHRP